MMRLYLDRRITRRKHLNQVYDDEGDLRFSSPAFLPCLEWLIENGHDEAQVYGETLALRIKIQGRVPLDD